MEKGYFMSDINHRRKNKKAVNQRYEKYSYHNGYAYPSNKTGVKGQQKAIEDVRAEKHLLGIDDSDVVYPVSASGAPRVGRTDYLDKSGQSWGRKSTFADKHVGAGISNDFTNGHRGMAKAVKGAKKFVNSRIRFQENAQTRKLSKNLDQD